jgi:hypothetical protein
MISAADSTESMSPASCPKSIGALSASPARRASAAALKASLWFARAAHVLPSQRSMYLLRCARAIAPGQTRAPMMS